MYTFWGTWTRLCIRSWSRSILSCSSRCLCSSSASRSSDRCATSELRLAYRDCSKYQTLKPFSHIMREVASCWIAWFLEPLDAETNSTAQRQTGIPFRRPRDKPEATSTPPPIEWRSAWPRWWPSLLESEGSELRLAYRDCSQYQNLKSGRHRQRPFRLERLITK